MARAQAPLRSTGLELGHSLADGRCTRTHARVRLAQTRMSRAHALVARLRLPSRPRTRTPAPGEAGAADVGRMETLPSRAPTPAPPEGPPLPPPPQRALCPPSLGSLDATATLSTHALAAHAHAQTHARTHARRPLPTAPRAVTPCFGACARVCQSRVVHFGAGESSFHALYEACAGSEETVLEGDGRAFARHASDFAYLCPSADAGKDGKSDKGGKGGKGDDGADVERDVELDRAHFDATRDALLAVGLDPAQHAQLLELVFGILHLGNLDFGESEEAEIAEIAESEDEADSALGRASALLHVPAAKLRDGLCLRRFKAGSEWVSASNTAVFAADVRHALAKQASARTNAHA
eukprot:1847954-Pleurochrysis_carterae.AAC.1